MSKSLWCVEQFFTKWMQITQQNPALVVQFAPMMNDLIEWWADVLAATDGNCAGIGEAAQQIMSSWNMVLMRDSSLGPVILPCVLKSLNSKHSAVRDGQKIASNAHFSHSCFWCAMVVWTLIGCVVAASAKCFRHCEHDQHEQQKYRGGKDRCPPRSVGQRSARHGRHNPPRRDLHRIRPQSRRSASLRRHYR